MVEGVSTISSKKPPDSLRSPGASTAPPSSACAPALQVTHLASYDSEAQRAGKVALPGQEIVLEPPRTPPERRQHSIAPAFFTDSPGCTKQRLR